MNKTRTYIAFVLGRSAGELSFKDGAWHWYDNGYRQKYPADATALDLKKSIAVRYREYDTDVHFIMED